MRCEFSRRLWPCSSNIKNLRAEGEDRRRRLESRPGPSSLHHHTSSDIRPPWTGEPVLTALLPGYIARVSDARCYKAFVRAVRYECRLPAVGSPNSKQTNSISAEGHVSCYYHLYNFICSRNLLTAFLHQRCRGTVAEWRGVISTSHKQPTKELFAILHQGVVLLLSQEIEDLL